MTAKYFFGRDEEDRGDRSHNLVGLVDGEEDIRVMLLVGIHISQEVTTHCYDGDAIFTYSHAPSTRYTLSLSREVYHICIFAVVPCMDSIVRKFRTPS